MLVAEFGHPATHSDAFRDIFSSRRLAEFLSWVLCAVDDLSSRSSNPLSSDSPPWPVRAIFRCYKDSRSSICSLYLQLPPSVLSHSTNTTTIQRYHIEQCHLQQTLLSRHRSIHLRHILSRVIARSPQRSQRL